MTGKTTLDKQLTTQGEVRPLGDDERTHHKKKRKGYVLPEATAKEYEVTVSSEQWYRETWADTSNISLLGSKIWAEKGQNDCSCSRPPSFRRCFKL